MIVGFTRSGRGRQRDANLVRKIEGEAEIFVHQAKRKTRRELAAQHVWRFDIENTGASHGRLHHLDEFFAGKAGALDKG